VIENPAAVYGRPQRVRYEWWLDPRPTLAQVAARVADERQALLVANTVPDARTMFGHLTRGTSTPVWHLGASCRRIFVDDSPIDRLSILSIPSSIQYSKVSKRCW